MKMINLWALILRFNQAFIKVFFLFILFLIPIKGVSNLSSPLSCDKNNYRAFISNIFLTNQLIYETGKGCQLEGINLEGQVLKNKDFRRANLRKARMAKAILRESIFDRAILKKADLTEADMWRVTLIRTKLNGAILTNAKIVSADIRGADLKGTEITGTDFRDSLYNHFTDFPGHDWFFRPGKRGMKFSPY